MSEWLAHPFVLLVAGAALSSVVLPFLTRRWQNHQKELELKTTLVTQITEAITRLVMAVQFAELGSTTQGQGEFDAAYREWETGSAVIASKLRAYFPKSALARDWEDLAGLTTRFYALTGMGGRKDQVRGELLSELRTEGPALDNDAAGELARWESLGVAENQRQWGELKARLLARRDELVRRVLTSRSAL